MKNMIKFTSQEWCEIIQLHVLDPDGWDRSSQKAFEKDWNKKISFEEFHSKYVQSTCAGMGHEAMFAMQRLFKKLNNK